MKTLYNRVGCFYTAAAVTFKYFVCHTEIMLVMSFCVQICYHMGSKTDPDQRDKQTDRTDIDILQRYIARCLPGLVPEPAVVESCMYTVGINTPDHSVHSHHSNPSKC